MDRAGLSANDGPTHHGLFDISYLRCVPNIIGMAPKDEDELVDMMFTASHQNKPTFIRYPRGEAEGTPIKDKPQILEVGKAEILKAFDRNGKKKVAIFSLGNMCALARNSVDILVDKGWDVAIVNPRFTKPIDEGTTLFFGKEADVVITMEDHVLDGGYGSKVLETFSDNQVSTPVGRIGWPDQFIEHASSVDYLRNKHGLTIEAMVEKVESFDVQSEKTQSGSALVG